MVPAALFAASEVTTLWWDRNAFIIIKALARCLQSGYFKLTCVS